MDSNRDAWISSILKLRHVSSSQTAVPENGTPSDDESDDECNRTPVESTPIIMVSVSDSCTDEEDEGTPPENDKFHTPPERMMKDGVSTDEEDTPSKKAKADELEEGGIVRTLLELKAGVYNADLEMALERKFGSKSCRLSSLGEGEKEGEDGKCGGVEMEIKGVISREEVDDAGEKCMSVKKSGSSAEEYGSNRDAELGELEIKGASFMEKDEMEEGVKKNEEKECGLSGVDSNNRERVREDISSECLELQNLGDDELKEGEDVNSRGFEIELKGLEEKVDDVVDECLTVKNLESSGVEYSIRELEVLESGENLTVMKHQTEEDMDENVKREEGFIEINCNNWEMERIGIERESLCRWTLADNAIKEGENGRLEGAEVEIEGLGSSEKLDDMVNESARAKKSKLVRVGSRELELEVAKAELKAQAENTTLDEWFIMLEKYSFLRWSSDDDEVEEGEDVTSGMSEMAMVGEESVLNLEQTENLNSNGKRGMLMVKNLEVDNLHVISSNSEKAAVNKEGSSELNNNLGLDNNRDVKLVDSGLEGDQCRDYIAEDVNSGGVEIELKGLEERVDEVVDECLTVKNLESSGVGYRIRELEALESGEDLTVMKQVEHQAEEDMDENVKREKGFIEINCNNKEMARKGIERESLCRLTLADNAINEGENGGLEGVEVEIEGLGSSEKLDDMVNGSVRAKKSKLVRVGSRELELEVAKAELKAQAENTTLDEWFIMLEKYSFLRSDDDEVEEGEDVTSGMSEMMMVGSIGLSARMADDHMTGEESVLNLEHTKNLYSNGKEGSSELNNNLGLDNNRDVKLAESGLEGDQCRDYVADDHEERNSLDKFKYGSAREGLEKVVNDENGGTTNNREMKEGIDVVKYIDANAKGMNSWTRILPTPSIGQGGMSRAGEEDQAAKADAHVGWTPLLGVLNRLADRERQNRKRKCCCEHTPKCCEGLDWVEMAKNHDMNFP